MSGGWMTNGLHPTGRRWAIAAGVGGGLLSGVHLVNLATVNAEALDFGREGSVLTLATAAFFALAGVLALRLAARDSRHRAAWVVLGIVGMAFALEKGGLMLHERFEDAASGRLSALTTVLIALTLLAIVIVLGRRLPEPAPRLLGLAAGVLVVAQVLGVTASKVGEGTAGDLLIALEESGEVGVALLLTITAIYFLAPADPATRGSPNSSPTPVAHADTVPSGRGEEAS